jgi:pyridoxine 4-dehydrogenase
MATTAQDSGTFKIGGDLEVTRLGFGAMRITGDGIWDEPADRDEALAVLRELPALGVDFIDTADSYGPFVSEELIAEALAPYDGGVTIATKAGLTRSGPGVWNAVGRPEYLRQCCEMSLRRLKVDAIGLYQLHRIDAKVDRDEQFAELAALQSEGKVRHLGLSFVSIEEIEAAGQHFPVATVQNPFNLVSRDREDVLDYCTQHDIGFIPYFPLAAGHLADPGGAVAQIAAAHDATAGQVALAWLLQRSPAMLPIPGTSSVAHLRENVGGASLRLTGEDVAALDAAA